MHTTNAGICVASTANARCGLIRKLITDITKRFALSGLSVTSAALSFGHLAVAYLQPYRTCAGQFSAISK